MSDPRAEARLYLAWIRGASGPWLPADAPAPAPPPRAGSAPARTSAAVSPAGPAGQSAASAAASAAGSASGSAAADLARLAAEVASCTRCRLHESRAQTVFGEGSPTPRLVVVGEAPGAEEDRTGRPFVGRAGALLDRMLGAIGLGRDDIFIANVLKCRPPDNRSPRPDEAAACRPFLQAQLEALGPPLLLALGSHAARLLLRTDRGITSLRGRFHASPEGWRVMPSFHPAYLLRSPDKKREAWEDLQRVAADLGLEIPPKGGAGGAS